MSYNATTHIDAEVEQVERRMLNEGCNYREIAKVLGVRMLSVAARNQNVYHIDIYAAFARRINRDGLGNCCRLHVSDTFGYWFSGFFDGEGCLAAHQRPQLRGGYTTVNRQLAMLISLRDDDLSTLEYIRENLGVGRIHHRAGHGAANPAATLGVQRLADIAEVIVPLFERYPLHTKKAREFPLWRKMAIEQYVRTLGGHSQRAKAEGCVEVSFDSDLAALRAIRAYHTMEA